MKQREWERERERERKQDPWDEEGWKMSPFYS